MTSAMIHVFFFLLVISIALGVGVIFLYVNLNQRLRQAVLRHYLGVLVCLGLAIFSDFSTVYFSLAFRESPGLVSRLLVAAGVMYHLLMGGLVYFLPQFVGGLIERPVGIKARRLLFFLMLFYPSGVVAYFITGQEYFAVIGDSLLLILIAHSIFRLFPRSKAGENPHLRKIANVFLILLAFFLPLFVLEVFFENAFPRFSQQFYDASLFLLLFHLIWNLVNALVLYRHFRLAFTTHAAGLSETRMDVYKLSKREQQIAHLIAAGASNKEISVQLSISTMTVKNHVYNIYKKTGASGRVDLVNILTEV